MPGDGWHFQPFIGEILGDLQLQQVIFDFYYVVAVVSFLAWINFESEVESTRLNSTKSQTIDRLFPVLYYIRDLFVSENCSFRG